MSAKGRISDETFEDFLAEQGILEEATEVALKRVIAWKIAEAMKAQKITKTLMATRMHTDRAQLARLLDPAKPGLTLNTLQRAADAIGYDLRIDLTPRASAVKAVKAVKAIEAVKVTKAKIAAKIKAQKIGKAAKATKPARISKAQKAA